MLCARTTPSTIPVGMRVIPDRPIAISRHSSSCCHASALVPRVFWINLSRSGSNEGGIRQSSRIVKHAGPDQKLRRVHDKVARPFASFAVQSRTKLSGRFKPRFPVSVDQW